MTYKEYEEEIMGMAESATDTARLRFARETIGLLRRLADAALAAELTDAEREMLSEILAGVGCGSIDGLRPKLKELTDTLCKDELRAVEFHPDITELLCAIDNLLVYASAKDSTYIGRVANMVNSFDHAVGGDSEAYSIQNMMTSEQMRSEYERQRRLLVCP